MSIEIKLTGEAAEQYMAWCAAGQPMKAPAKRKAPAKPKAPAAEKTPEAPPEKPEPIDTPPEPPAAEKATEEDRNNVVPIPAPAGTEDTLLESVDELRARFEDLIKKDYDTALAIIDETECENFTEAVAAGKIELIAKRLAEAV